MNLNLKNRVAVVTGGSSGIGLATVRMLLTAGAKVAFCGRDQGRLDKALEELSNEAPASHLYARCCDVLDQAQVQEFRQTVEERFEGLNILVNNAGQGNLSTFADTTDEVWSKELELKFFSLIYPTRAFLPLLEKSDAAAIVCVNSLLALQPESHMVATSAARAGALNLVHSMAKEFAHKGIRVNSVLLGVVESGQWRRRYETQAKPDQSWEEWSTELAAKRNIPLGRLGKPEEAAAAILFLASSLSSYTTGSYIDVSGGLSRRV